MLHRVAEVAHGGSFQMRDVAPSPCRLRRFGPYGDVMGSNSAQEERPSRFSESTLQMGWNLIWKPRIPAHTHCKPEPFLVRSHLSGLSIRVLPPKTSMAELRNDVEGLNLIVVSHLRICLVHVLVNKLVEIVSQEEGIYSQRWAA